MPFGIAESGGSIELAIAVGVPYAALTAALFGYVAWRSYEPSLTTPNGPVERRLAARSAAAMIAIRLIWYVGVVALAVTVVPQDRVLGIVLIVVLLVFSIVASLLISRRLQNDLARRADR